MFDQLTYWSFKIFRFPNNKQYQRSEWEQHLVSDPNKLSTSRYPPLCLITDTDPECLYLSANFGGKPEWPMQDIKTLVQTCDLETTKRCPMDYHHFVLPPAVTLLAPKNF
jgi:hypothetical protein